LWPFISLSRNRQQRHGCVSKEEVSTDIESQQQHVQRHLQAAHAVALSRPLTITNVSIAQKFQFHFQFLQTASWPSCKLVNCAEQFRSIWPFCAGRAEVIDRTHRSFTQSTICRAKCFPDDQKVGHRSEWRGMRSVASIWSRADWSRRPLRPAPTFLARNSYGR